MVSSIGIGGDAFFQSLLEKKSGITSLAHRTDEGAKPGPSLDLPGMWIGGPIVDFEAKQYVRPRKALKVMCREIQTAFAASQLAVADAGLADLIPADPDGTLPPESIGTVFGSEMFYGAPAEMEDAVRGCYDGWRPIATTQPEPCLGARSRTGLPAVLNPTVRAAASPRPETPRGTGSRSPECQPAGCGGCRARCAR